MLLVSGASATVRRVMGDPRLGCLLRPGNGNYPDARPWAVDNGAFSGFDAEAFVSALERFRRFAGCLWVASPDVVSDAVKTLSLFGVWEPLLHAQGWPVAFVAQDGQTHDPPWEHFECLFIGGSTGFKLGTEAMKLAIEAKRLGKHVHMGRVNTIRRMTYAHAIGCDSFDGTAFSRFPDIKIPWALKALARIEKQTSLWNVRRT